MDIRVSVIGAGSWGTTVAALAAHNAPTTLWSRRATLAEQIDRDHENGDYLAGYRLPSQLRATADLERAVRDADLLVMGVPSQGFRGALESVKPYLRPWVPVISLSKGLELGSRLRMSQLVEEVLPVGQRVYALGEVADTEDEGVVLRTPTDEQKDRPFMLSTKTEEELLQKSAKSQTILRVIGAVVGVGGLALVVLGILR